MASGRHPDPFAELAGDAGGAQAGVFATLAGSFGGNFSCWRGRYSTF